MKDQFHIDREPEILLFGEGEQSFFVPAKSYLREFIPFALERISRHPTIKESEVYKTMLEKAMNYSGKYIYIEPEWFHIELIPEFQDKVGREYDLVYSNMPLTRDGKVNLYRRKGTQ